ncbi:MAG: proprotein convertase P-domain-containing protein [Planctomycetota bacterium]
MMLRNAFVSASLLTILATSLFAQQSSIPGQPPAGTPPQFGQKSDPGDYHFYAGGRGEVQVPLVPSTDMISVRFLQNVDAGVARGVLLSTPGISGAAASINFTERNSAYIPLNPGLTLEQVRTVANQLENDERVVYAELIYFHETERFGGTNRFITKFADHLTARDINALVAPFQLSIDRALASGPNTFVIEVPKGSPMNAVEMSNFYLEYFRELTDYSNPDFVVDRVTTYTPNDTNYPNQWHLNSTGQSGAKVNADVDAPEAWDITQGSASIIIAVIDEGTDTTHEDLSFVTGWNAIQNNNSPSGSSTERHGTAVSGVAAGQGSNGKGVSGSCPKCKVMPIRLIVSGMTIADEAESFNFAWQNGAHIINNSWGPIGSVATLPSSTKAAIDAATTNGRGGKGCVVLFASGNDNKNSDSNGYSAYSGVISVAASTDQDLRASYSNWGNTVDVCAPSNGGVTSGIWTTDRMGTSGYSTGNYTNTFGGTSSATPLTSGICGLILTVNPNLTYTEVRTNLINNTIKIDTAGGGYVNGFSATKYAWGKVNAKNSVVAAGGTPPPPPPPTGTTKTYNSTNVPLAIPDNNTTGITSNNAVADSGTLNTLTCSVNITHTYQGDLTVSLVHPDNSTAVLWNKTGGGTDNIVATFTVTTFANKQINGTWKLKVTDTAAQDIGTLNSWSMTINYNPTAGPQTFNFSASPALAIPDNNTTGITATINASGVTGTVTDVNIFVNVSHTYKGDLTITLIHPDGTNVILHNKTGGSADNVVTTFDTLTAPAQSLTVLNGKPGNGTWALKVTDTAAVDVGTLNSWTVTIITQ